MPFGHSRPDLSLQPLEPPPPPILPVSASAPSPTSAGVGITIYNAELALVRDRRRIDAADGESHLALRDVSAQIQPETALLQSVGAPGRIAVLEQNFDYDLLSPEMLLE